MCIRFKHKKLQCEQNLDWIIMYYYCCYFSEICVTLWALWWRGWALLLFVGGCFATVTVRKRSVCAAVLSMVLTTPRFFKNLRPLRRRCSQRQRSTVLRSFPVAFFFLFTRLCTVCVQARVLGASARVRNVSMCTRTRCWLPLFFLFTGFVGWTCSGKKHRRNLNKSACVWRGRCCENWKESGEKSNEPAAISCLKEKLTLITGFCGETEASISNW